MIEQLKRMLRVAAYGGNKEQFHRLVRQNNVDPSVAEKAWSDGAESRANRDGQVCRACGRLS
ncbi:MAG: hypothetical protein HOE44_12260 [Candidatus Marinimicrobia bacterium]|jgi:hypothetical protein|nr:hypothetical protein [Candidatus Neomarinimicrobiota bacterium]